MKKRNTAGFQKRVYLGILAGTALLNAAAWLFSPGFCDWYIAHIFPLWVNTYGRFCGLFPFSVGELLLTLGVFLVLAAVIIGICLAVRFLWRKIRTLQGKNVKEERRGARFVKGFYRAFAWLLLGVLVIMTLNCSLLYHCTTLEERYYAGTEREYTLEDLIWVRNYVVEKCNELSALVPRDEKGEILYDGDIRAEAVGQMKRLGETYEGLSGYYPSPKPMIYSDFMCQQYMEGYFFPFSMEANYNDVMCFMNKPSTLCHELAHLKGFIYEDEASFIGFLACTTSSDMVFEYSGYLGVLYYLDNDFYAAIGENLERYYEQPQILPIVHADNLFVKQDDWDRINEAALIDTETVEAASDTFTDVTLKLSGIEDGKLSYTRVVRLLLRYYDSIYSLPSQQ